MPDTLSFDDIEELYHSAETADRPLTVAEELIAAVEQDRLADASDASYALLAASDIVADEGDPERATELARRAMLAEGAPDHDRHVAQATYGQMLVEVGRHDDGMAALAALRPALLSDPPLIEFLIDVLIEMDRTELALEWLTDAVEQKKEEVAAAPESEGPDHLESFYQLIRVRHDVRHELDLPHDGYDELFEQMAAAQEGEGEDVLIFWPRDDFAQLLRRWPELAERLGADWDEHRADLEQSLVELSESSASPPLLLAASVEGLIAFAAELDEDNFGPGESHEPGDPDVMLAYAEDLEGPVLAWPPGRNDACWCGSGLKYKKCCLPRARL